MRLALICAGLVTFCSAAAWAADTAGDYPCKHFQVLPSDMPKPFATPAVENSSQTIPRPAGVVPQVPKGFTAAVFADHLDNPRWMAVAPNGDVFLAQPKTGVISLLRD